MSFADPYEEEPKTVIEALSRRHAWHRFLSAHKLAICFVLTTGAILPPVLLPDGSGFIVTLVCIGLFGLMYMWT